MKKNNYIIACILAFISFYTCSEISDFDLVEDPNALRRDEINPDFVLNEIQLSFANTINSFSGNTSEIMRYEAMTDAYSKFYGKNKLNSNWIRVYKNRISRLTIEDFVNQDSKYVVHRGIAKVLNAYEFATLVDYLGDIPYSDIDPIASFSPNPEDDASIYEKLIAEIDLAIADFKLYLSDPLTYQLPTNDLYFNTTGASGIDRWIRLANSLKLKLYVSIGESKLTEINELLADNNLINTPNQDFQFQYSRLELPTDSRHPDFISWYTVGRSLKYMGNYFITLLKDAKSKPDPRLRYYLYREAEGEIEGLECETNPYVEICNPGDWYLGKDHGDDFEKEEDDIQIRTIYGRYPVGGWYDYKNPDELESPIPPTPVIMEGDGIQPILLSSMVSFFKAEAVLRLGATSAEAPEVLLENGIRNSINKVINFGPSFESNFTATQDDVDEYTNEVVNEFMASPSNDTKLDIVIRELYIASFGNSIEAYNAYRRTGFPSNIQLSIRGIVAPFPRTFSLPSSAVDRNVNINQRPVTTKVFWDTNPDNFIN